MDKVVLRVLDPIFPGWFVFQQLDHEAAGLHPLRKKMADVDAVTVTDAKPLNCDAIEPGLVEAISQMPAKLQRWMLAPPREPPRWRTDRPTTETGRWQLVWLGAKSRHSPD
jgi:hypothetical protein